MDPIAAEARERLGELARRPDKDLNLAEAALLIAREEYRDLDIGHYLERLDKMAEDLQRRLPSPCTTPRATEILSAFLYQERGFSGNNHAYYDPRNSFLNEVLDRRLGIPITLSTVYLEIARRVGLEVEGIGLPGHFLLRYRGCQGFFYIDAFNGRIFLTEEDCRERVRQMYNGSIAFKPDFLEPISKRRILTRILYNLKGIYIHREDYPRALAATDRILLLNPDATGELRDRGLLYFRLECFRNALRDLDAYLDRTPDAADAKEVRGHIQELTKLVSRIN